MKQCIIFGFYCKKAIKNPIFRLYVAGQLIDEQQIPAYEDAYFQYWQDKNVFRNPWKYNDLQDVLYLKQQGNSQKLYPPHILQPAWTAKTIRHWSNVKITHPHLFCYWVDHDVLCSQKRILFEIIGADADVNNGFIKKNCQVALHNFYVVPDKFVQKSEEVLERLSRKKHRSAFFKQTSDAASILKYYKERLLVPINFFKHFCNAKGTRAWAVGGHETLQLDFTYVKYNFFFTDIELYRDKLYRAKGYVHFNKAVMSAYFKNIINIYKNI